MRGNEFNTNDYVDTTKFGVEMAMALRDASKNHETKQNQDESLEHIVTKAVDQSLKKLIEEVTNPVHGATENAIMPEHDEDDTPDNETFINTDNSAPKNPEPETNDVNYGTDDEHQIDSASTKSSDIKDICALETPSSGFKHESEEVASRLESGMDFILHYDGVAPMEAKLEEKINQIKAYQEVLRSKFMDVDALKKYLVTLTDYYFDPRIYLIFKLIYTEPHPWKFLLGAGIFDYNKYFFFEAKNEFDYLFNDIRRI